MFRLYYLILSFMLLLPLSLFSDEDVVFSDFENEIIKNIKQISKYKTDSVNKIYSDSVYEKISKVVYTEGSFEYKFDSLSNYIGIINSPDKKIRIYNWNLLLENGEYLYYALIQYVNKKGEQKIFSLKDNSSGIDNSESFVGNPENWYGMLYYDIIFVENKNDDYYILLAWDGNNYFTNKKFIDVLYFDEDDTPFFGKDVFEYKGKGKMRIAFEYSEKCSMAVDYNQELKMIVFDHLSPSKPIYKDMYEYYGADFSYDALKCDKGTWKLMEDIDVRNSKSGNKKK